MVTGEPTRIGREELYRMPKDGGDAIQLTKNSGS